MKDIETLSPLEIMNKYIFCDYCWYFSEVLKHDEENAIRHYCDFKDYIKNQFQQSDIQIFVVGSSKMGVSIKKSNLYAPFRIISKGKRKASDLDVAIISSELYHQYWGVFRKSYKPTLTVTYDYISREIYRGYINERNINEVQNCRRLWHQKITSINKYLRKKYIITHEINYRIYRNLDDFLEYNTSNIESIKRRIV